jgi:ABC-type uncharacterized transport system auxiliary subunit
VTNHRAARRLTNAVAALAMLALAGGCFRGSLPPREYYRLQLPDTLMPPRVVEAAAAPAPLQGSLAVGAYRAPGLYGRSGLVFRLNGTEYGSYPSREWAIPLGDQLGLLTEAVMRRAPLTSDGALFDPPNERSHTYLWRGTIREFEEVDRPDGTVHAAVRLEAVLIRARDDSVLWSRSVRVERAVAQPTMNGIVEALSALAVEAVGSLVAEARVHLTQPASARVGDTPR